MNKKKVLSKILERAFILRAVSSVQNRPFLTVLAYHRVRDVSADFMFDPALVSAGAEEFKWQIDYLKQYYSIISFRDFLNNVRDPSKLPKNPIVISFDDGYDRRSTGDLRG